MIKRLTLLVALLVLGGGCDRETYDGPQPIQRTDKIPDKPPAPPSLPEFINVYAKITGTPEKFDFFGNTSANGMAALERIEPQLEFKTVLRDPAEFVSPPLRDCELADFSISVNTKKNQVSFSLSGKNCGTFVDGLIGPGATIRFEEVPYKEGTIGEVTVHLTR